MTSAGPRGPLGPVLGSVLGPPDARRQRADGGRACDGAPLDGVLAMTKFTLQPPWSRRHRVITPVPEVPEVPEEAVEVAGTAAGPVLGRVKLRKQRRQYQLDDVAYQE